MAGECSRQMPRLAVDCCLSMHLACQLWHRWSSGGVFALRRLATVFSAPNYCDQMGNLGAFVRFNGRDMTPQFTTFSAVPHPEIRPMAYAQSFMNSGLFGF
jgi:hypothetical protein